MTKFLEPSEGVHEMPPSLCAPLGSCFKKKDEGRIIVFQKVEIGKKPEHRNYFNWSERQNSKKITSSKPKMFQAFLWLIFSSSDRFKKITFGLFVCCLLGWGDYPQTLQIFFNFEFEFNIDFDFDFDFELVSDLLQSTVLTRVNSRKSAETKKLWIGFPVVRVLSLSIEVSILFKSKLFLGHRQP